MTNSIIDAHQHYWTIKRNDYGWLTPDLKQLYQDYLPADLIPHLQANKVTGTVLIQAAPTIDETDYLLQLAQSTPTIKAVVGWVDLTCKATAHTLASLASNTYFKGVRPMLQDLADPNWLVTAPQYDTIQALIDHQLTLDLLIKTEHIDAVVAFAQQWPKLAMIVDHAAKPPFTTHQFKQWQQHIYSLAAFPNIHVKLSGFYEAGQQAMNATYYQPYIDTLIQYFGSERIIWGSNWPVLNCWGSYQQWLTTCQECIARYGTKDNHNIFYHNAISFYHLAH